MSFILTRWNTCDRQSALRAMMDCCGAQQWAAAMVEHRPINTESELHEAADRFWGAMTETDWMEAFSHHPRIGERKAPQSPSQSSAWSGQEQSSMQTAADSMIATLASANAEYEKKFGFTYIVCATGKSPEQMLAILESRLANTLTVELREAAEQQRLIMHIRLRKWLEL